MVPPAQPLPPVPSPCPAEGGLRSLTRHARALGSPSQARAGVIPVCYVGASALGEPLGAVSPLLTVALARSKATGHCQPGVSC